MSKHIGEMVVAYFKIEKSKVLVDWLNIEISKVITD